MHNSSETKKVHTGQLYESYCTALEEPLMYLLQLQHGLRCVCVFVCVKCR